MTVEPGSPAVGGGVSAVGGGVSAVGGGVLLVEGGVSAEGGVLPDVPFPAAPGETAPPGPVMIDPNFRCDLIFKASHKQQTRLLFVWKTDRHAFLCGGYSQAKRLLDGPR